MDLSYRNQQIEKYIYAANTAVAVLVAVSFALYFGFSPSLIPPSWLLPVQLLAVAVFMAEKAFELWNVRSVTHYIRANWGDFILLGALLLVLVLSAKFENAVIVRQFAIGIYVLLQITSRTARKCLNLALHGKNPTWIIMSAMGFLVIGGTAFLYLPNAAATKLTLLDSFFTAVSAVTLTGLTVTNSSTGLTSMGHHVILVLMQFGGLGVIMYGAVLAFMVSQAMQIRSTETMQDMLEMETVRHTGRMVAFIIVVTLAIELIGAVLLLDAWRDYKSLTSYDQWFGSIFYSVSAFCNAGFGLENTSVAGMKNTWSIYLVLMPLIVIGGLGFDVLYNIASVIKDRFSRLARSITDKKQLLFGPGRKRLDLQAKIVLVMTAVLITLPVFAILVFENNIPKPQAFEFTTTQESIFPSSQVEKQSFGLLDSLFVTVSSRTAGLRTVDISRFSDPSLAVLAIVMLIGGSPVSTAGGIKTVTLAILILSAYSVIRKRRDVEVFGRSVRLFVVGRAMTIVLLFLAVLVFVTLALTITERHGGFTLEQIFFETSSALSNSGLSTGITPALTVKGKVYIILTMLIGRFGPLMLIASLTTNIRPVKYEYPEEAVVVG